MTVAVSIVVPVYRNVDTLLELYERVTRAMEACGHEYEILFVDDACPAGSHARLRDLARRDARVAALLLERNGGQNRAVMAGLAFARGEIVVVLDADLQDPPEAIGRLVGGLYRDVSATFG